ncbi:MAG: GNAT family N-acetyltransferase [Chloroflexota bacterium]
MTYRIHLTGAEACPEVVIRFRQEICRGVGLNPEGPAAQPLDVASYLFAMVDGCSPPVGMIEFFFYDQAFRSFSDAVYSQAADLGAIAPMSEMAHIRSVFVAADWRRTPLFRYLMAAMVVSAHRMGARYMTAGTGLHNRAILALHRRAGMAPLGQYEVDGSAQQLSLLQLDLIVPRAEAILEGGVDFDDSLAQALRQRKVS